MCYIHIYVCILIYVICDLIIYTCCFLDFIIVYIYMDMYMCLFYWSNEQDNIGWNKNMKKLIRI